MPRPSPLTIEIHRAIIANELVAVTAAIDAGGDVNGVSGGCTPVFRAVLEARPDVVALLLERGAEFRKRDRQMGRTPLELALLNTHRLSRRYFTGRAIKDSLRVAALLARATPTDDGEGPILGAVGDEAQLTRESLRRGLSADQPIVEADGILVLSPSTAGLDPEFKANRTLAEFATKRRFRQLQAALERRGSGEM